jgi:Flp pilus assembly pilin Flp
MFKNRQLVPRRRDQRGQATAEYALVILGAATIAILLLVWAQQTGAIGSLFDKVMSSITSQF